ncbi:zinc ribbon domain-containing protein [uncultured Veillonella sp.]|uniref:zinc ribbon domain-containing protein n=1 Tax=uncultured Veillonella sp. TaxID=159268 RepID=UPI00262BAC2A|nr:zinc ribbon domain-containing protein [uncultured Veillonella sp.]
MFCMKCGSQLADDAKFCTTCGTATDNVGAVPSGIATADGTGSVPTVPPSAMVPPGGQGVPPMAADGGMPPTGNGQQVGDMPMAALPPDQNNANAYGAGQPGAVGVDEFPSTKNNFTYRKRSFWDILSGK